MAEKAYFTPFPGYHWNGEWVQQEVTEYWCPTDKQWCMCSGPCPDGQEHEPTRKRITEAKLMVRND